MLFTELPPNNGLNLTNRLLCHVLSTFSPTFEANIFYHIRDSKQVSVTWYKHIRVNEETQMHRELGLQSNRLRPTCSTMGKGS